MKQLYLFIYSPRLVKNIVTVLISIILFKKEKFGVYSSEFGVKKIKFNTLRTPNY